MRSHQIRFITILEILIKLKLIIVEQIFLKTFFFLTQQLSGINLILMFVSLNILCDFSKYSVKIRYIDLTNVQFTVSIIL